MFVVPGYWLILVNGLAWFVLQVSIGYLMHKMPEDWLKRFSPLLRPRKWEKGGTLYQRTLFVKKWKTWIPPGDTFFAGGFSLKQVASTQRNYLEKWVLESYRAELTHWISILPILLFFLWNPPIGWLLNWLYALLANLPCIIVQRYNRPRLLAILERKHASSEVNRKPIQPQYIHTQYTK